MTKELTMQERYSLLLEKEKNFSLKLPILSMMLILIGEKITREEEIAEKVFVEIEKINDLLTHISALPFANDLLFLLNAKIEKSGIDAIHLNRFHESPLRDKLAEYYQHNLQKKEEAYLEYLLIRRLITDWFLNDLDATFTENNLLSVIDRAIDFSARYAKMETKPSDLQHFYYRVAGVDIDTFKQPLTLTDIDLFETKIKPLEIAIEYPEEIVCLEEKNEHESWFSRALTKLSQIWTRILNLFSKDSKQIGQNDDLFKNQSDREKLATIVLQLQKNMEINRWTSGVGSTKYKKLNDRYRVLSGTTSVELEQQKEVIHRICKKQRHPWITFWKTPETVQEYQDLVQRAQFGK